MNESFDVWTPKQAAAYIKVEHHTFLNWLRGKNTNGGPSSLQHSKPPHIRFSRNCTKIPIDDFKKWVEDVYKKCKET